MADTGNFRASAGTTSSVGDGITVVMPAYRDAHHVLAAVESLDAQTFAHDRFEIVLVLNGPAATDRTPYVEFARDRPDLGLRVITTTTTGVCHALNLGIQAARMPWITFVDDDDRVSPRYLGGLYAVAGPGVVPLAGIHDIAADGSIETSNRLNDRIGPLTGQAVDASQCIPALTFTACKLMPTDWARGVLYDGRLRSGQDVAFFGAMYAKYDFQFAVVPSEFDAVYLRTLSADSLSRRDATFEFSVTERLDVIATLAERLRVAPARKAAVLRSLIRSQAMFVREYLLCHRGEHERVRAAVESAGVGVEFPWRAVIQGTAKHLVVSVCFPPFADASSITIAKRIRQRGEPVDVVYNDMGSVRPHDLTLDSLVADLAASRLLVRAPATFGDWEGAQQFCNLGMRSLEAQLGGAWPYRSMYSRAMWPASHVLAGLLSTQHPDTTWIAEFSDPVTRTVTGEPRPGPRPEGDLMRQLMEVARCRTKLDLPEPQTVFELAELIPYALADELVFTNQLQLDYMMDVCPVPALASIARTKATIAPHPTPPDHWYTIVPVGDPADSLVRLAYFGNFYSNRSFGEILEATAGLPTRVRRRLRLDVYSDSADSLHRELRERSLHDVVTVRPTVGYLEFLALTRRYTCLIVNDTTNAESHGRNPYLPSKLSDYRGSGTRIWSLVAPASTLSQVEVDYKSPIGDVAKARDVLMSIVMDFPDDDAPEVGSESWSG